MTEFRYVGRTIEGRSVKGALSAESRDAALASLVGQGVTPLRLKAAPEARGPTRLSYADAAAIAGDLARVVRTGVGIEAGLKIVAGGRRSGAVRASLERAERTLTEGGKLSEAFDFSDSAAGRALTSAVSAGERAGDLAGALESVRQVMASIAKFRARMISLSIYPGVVALTGLGVLILFFTVVIPSLRPVFETIPGGPPASARILLAAAEIAPRFATAVLIAALAWVLAQGHPPIKAAARRITDRIMLSPAGLGLASSIDLTVFASLCAAFLEAGAPSGEAFARAAAGVDNVILRERLEKASSDIWAGVAPDEALAGALGPDHQLVHAVRFGSKTGAFATILKETADGIGERAEARMERLSSIAAPMVIVTLGAIIGGFVLTLFLSLSEIPDAIG